MLTNLNRKNKYSLIALIEPFHDPIKIEQYKINLGFDNALVKLSGKIWIFWNVGWVGSVVLDSIQQITMKFCIGNRILFITFVYTRCDALDRLEL